jgi:two-component system, OmpR family, phosphate regulon sensor histidine kinase PhoR
MKNLTPFQIALFTSFCVALVSGIGFMINNLFLGHFEWHTIFVYLIIIFLVSFFIFRLALERFIYRKIKLIYKTISDFKSGKTQSSKKVNLHKDFLDQTGKDVEEWSKNYESEFDELKKLESYRREFLTNLSHELKTPIFNIQGYLHTLLDGGLKDKKINKKYLEKAANNLDHLSNIVYDLDIISRLESGELPIVLEKFDIHQLIHDVIDSQEIHAEKNLISVGFKEGCNSAMNVIADKEKIKQVINNLISNSIKYGKPEGKTQVGIYDMAENVLIEVSDDGIGIGQEHLPRLFERFYRVDKSRSRKEGGSGLGLAIVKHIVEAHNQSINVRSSPGIGSTFGFTLKKA